MCYREFPVSTVIYNAVTLGGAVILGILIVAQLGLGAAVGYLALLVAAVVGLLATVCARCGYHGRRCALGLGLVVRVFRKKPEDEFFCTWPQFVSLLLLASALALPIVCGVGLLVIGFDWLRLALLAGMVGLLLAGLIPHPRLVCGHCCQGESGACPVGRAFWNAK